MKNSPSKNWDQLTQKQILFWSLAHNLNIYQYIEIETNESWEKKPSPKDRSVLNDFINARQECYDKRLVDWWEALHEANKYRKKWELRKAAMFVLCAWEMDWELTQYTTKNIDMINMEVEKYNTKKELFDSFDDICVN